MADARRAPVSMSLGDGRRFSWYEYGDSAGRACLFLPGAATSGLAGLALNQAAEAEGIRLISVDRPGMGHSDRAPSRPLVDFPGDVEQLVNHLELNNFTVLGHSIGGAYALAVTQRLPDRVDYTIVGAGSAPYSESWTRGAGMTTASARLYFWLALRAPRVFGALHLLSTPRSTKGIDRLLAVVSRGKSPDAEFARTHAEQTRASFEALADGCRRGAAGPTGDLAAVCRPWGFDLGDVSGPVEWWHGEQDTNVTPRSGRAVADRLPRATAHFIDGGHYLLFSHAHQIMRSLATRSAPLDDAE